MAQGDQGAQPEIISPQRGQAGRATRVHDEVQKLLGHHDPKVTMRYAHLAPQAMLDAANVVGNAIARRPAAAQDTGEQVPAAA